MMDGKTFVRIFYFAQSYGHGWADALLSEAACEDAVAGPFARAAWKAQDAADTAERMAAEEEMASLADGFEGQKALIEAADRLRKAEGRDNPGIFAGDSFYERILGALKHNGEIERNGGFNYDHVTGSKRLEVWVKDDNVDFVVSRSNERELFCVSVSLADGGFRVYSGEPDSFLAEDHDACVRRWEKYLRLRHVWALEEAVRAFFSLVADHELRADVLAAVHAEAAAVFREQPLTAEVSFWDWKEEERCTAVLREGDSYLRRGNASVPLPPATRSLLLQELERVHTLSPNAPTLMPFDYSPSSPEVSFFRDFFKLPTEGVPYSGMRGVFAVLGTACHGLPAGNGEHCDAEFFFAVGVRSRDVKRCAAKYTDHAPSSALRKGLEDAVAERSADGAFWNQRDVRLCVDYPAQSLAALGGDWNAPGAEPWDNGIRTYTTDTAHAAGGKELDL